MKKQIPITVNYDRSHVIGTAEVETDALPRHLCWVLAPRMAMPEGGSRDDMDTIEFSVVLDKELQLCEEAMTAS